MASFIPIGLVERVGACHSRLDLESSITRKNKDGCHIIRLRMATPGRESGMTYKEHTGVSVTRPPIDLFTFSLFHVFILVSHR